MVLAVGRDNHAKSTRFRVLGPCLCQAKYHSCTSSYYHSFYLKKHSIAESWTPGSGGRGASVGGQESERGIDLSMHVLRAGVIAIESLLLFCSWLIHSISVIVCLSV